MLQNVRDNMKGTLATVVVIMFVAPMVLVGVGGDVLGNITGTDAASVNGKGISNTELSRAVYSQKQRLLSQDSVDPTADYLKDENLRGPVLERLIRRTALVTSAEDSGMGMPSSTVDKFILEQKQFHVDGKFDQQRYRQLLDTYRFTPTTYSQSVSEDLILTQQAKSLQYSSFVTSVELDAIVGVIGESRTFGAIKIPASASGDDFVVTDEEISGFYDDNQSTYVEKESLSVDYIELSIDELAKLEEVPDSEVRAQYDTELTDLENSDVEVAHILIEDGDNSETRIAEVSQKLKVGETFESLVEAYTDDVGSKSNEGFLGELSGGGFPEEFTSTVVSLKEGGVSEPFKTEAGTHFLKVLKKKVPTFEERENSIRNDIARSAAAETFDSLAEEMGDLTYSADDLISTAESLGLTIKTSEPFSRDSGTGIATYAPVREAAYDSVVLNEGQNSQVLSVTNDRAIVLRKNTHSPERIKPLDEVRNMISLRLKGIKKQDHLEALANELIAKLKSGGDEETLAKELGYEFAKYTSAKRTDMAADRALLAQAFSMPVQEGKSYNASFSATGGYVVTILESVAAGTQADMPPQQLLGMTSQLGRENSSFETTSFEADLYAKANKKIH